MSHKHPYTPVEDNAGSNKKSVSGEILTAQLNASPNKCETNSLRPFRTVSAMVFGLRMESKSTQLGNEMKVVIPPDMMRTAYVQDVGQPLMELRSALEHRKLVPLTPYKADTWKQELQ
ncbi:hypothetical protein BDR03DRAFT_1018872 [Suillus americanus]|nr:hypothetical protein BDR03DRAFT_1018872 [Suillus americanus]